MADLQNDKAASVNSTQQLSQDTKNLSYANELYEKARALSQHVKPLDQHVARIIIISAEDATREFGNTNQEKKIELKQMISEAEKVLPPATIEELRKRAEGQLLHKAYPQKLSTRNFLLAALAIIIVASIAWPVLNFISSVTDKEPLRNATPSESSNSLGDKPEMKHTVSPSVSSQLPPISLQIQPDVSTKKLDSVLKSLRTARQLRAIAPLESGKSIEQTPAGTFFYMWMGYLVHSEGEIGEVLKHDGVETKSLLNSAFEIHKLSEDEIDLIAFVSKDTAQLISRLDGKSKKEVVLSAIPWEDNTTMIILPINRLIVIKRRDITKSDGTSAPAMDTIVQ